MIYLILSGIILICLVVIIGLVWVKLPKLKAVDKKLINAEKQAKTKKRLLESKLEKKFLNLSKHISQLFRNLPVGLKKWFNYISLRFKSGLRLSRVKPLKVKKSESENDKTAIAKAGLLEAQVLLKKRQFDQAEDKYIKVLEIDPKNIEAYMGLGEIYGFRKDWQTAEEAYRYIIKIKPNFFDGYKQLANLFRLAKKWQALRTLCEEVLALGQKELWVYMLLGLANKKTGYPDKAEEYFKQAAELMPRNEEVLDHLLEVAIINKNKQLAKKAFNTLLGICGDEIKLQSYRDKIDIL